MTENKVVIKINYDKSKQKKQSEPQPHMVTEWHLGRIILALVLIVSMGGLLTYWLLSPVPVEQKTLSQPVLAKNEHIKKANKESQQNTISNKKVVKENKAVNGINEKQQSQNPTKPVTVNETEQSSVKQVNKKETQSTVVPLIKDERISRLILAKALNNKEPVGEVSLPILADKNRAIGVFFFTEINNMKGEVLFHHWLRNDKSVFKRKIHILGNRWRAVTSKLITYSGKGHWVVMLTDIKGNILGEIEFDVI
ncbi:DUF2914 domain-containing protein [Methylomarinum vadi]|uniref:DUF2914 domain-containing protein n=1 Tax=Methylomarinum vadi TaxID=438855 RepID=UPI0013623645|nr:DUF2914 domain-containing protein [Methylomarinum vadi]